VKSWCSVYACCLEAAPGSEFCRVKHGWWEAEPDTPPAAESELEPVLLVLVRDCVGCAQSFEQPPRVGRPFTYCDECRGVAA